MNGKERIGRILDGLSVDRPAIFDLLRNDAAIEHYSGQKLTLENARQVVYKAVGAAIDGTRPSVKLPEAERTIYLPDGRKQAFYRWTAWTEHLKFASNSDYEKHVRKNHIDCWTSEAIEQQARGFVKSNGETAYGLAQTFLFWNPGTPIGLMGLYGEVGLDQFALYLCDCPELISEAIEATTAAAVETVRGVDKFCGGLATKTKAIFLGEDIAFKGATLFSPAFLRKEFFPRLKRIIAAYHSIGIKVMYHSDGDLMNVMDDLIDAGIDLLNPIETMAGMDVKELHRRYPKLLMAGGIDVSSLLPYGTVMQVKDAVVKAIEDAEGRILLGSSTEMQHGVPLENVLALYETVRNYRY